MNEIVSPTEQLEPNLFRGSPPGTTVGLLDPAHANGQRSGEGSDISSVMQAPELARADSTGNWEVLHRHPVKCRVHGSSHTVVCTCAMLDGSNLAAAPSKARNDQRGI